MKVVLELEVPDDFKPDRCRKEEVNVCVSFLVELLNYAELKYPEKNAGSVYAKKWLTAFQTDESN